MDVFFVFRFVMGCVEETVKSILNEFSVDLFKLVLKKNIYEVLSSDEYEHNVMDVINKIKIHYDFSGSDAESDDDQEDSDKKQMIDNYLEKLDEIGEEIEINIDIPIGSIIQGIKKMVNDGEIILDYDMRDVMRDTNIINEIWENWIPTDDFARETKSIADHLIESIELPE